MIDKIKSLLESLLVKLGIKKPKVERKKKIRRKKTTKK
tara:strand:- start:1863 stop:1976 length:114 start_codon:yes stop_codon:yes gene_type:complete